MFATETKEVTLYSYDDKGVFNAEFKYLWVVGTGIASNSTLEKPLKEKDGFVTVWNGSEWEHKENHIGKTIYNTKTKESKKVDYVGEILQGWTFLEPDEFDEWDGSKWMDNRTDEEITSHKRSLMPTLKPIDFDIKLNNAGLYDSVQELIKDNFNLRIAYTRATYFSRTDPFIDQARIALGLTNEQVDELWTAP